jgi:carbon starvation CstA-like protein
MKIAKILLWIAVAALGALAFATIALRRGEAISAMWLVVAAICSYALGYRFYSKFVAAKVLCLDPHRATPAERMENGRDFMPTNKWVVFGRYCGPRASGWARARGAIWLSAWDAVDPRRRSLRRMRAGLRCPAFLRPPRW